MHPTLTPASRTTATLRQVALIDARAIEDTYLLNRAVEPPCLRHPEPLVDPGQAYGSVLRQPDGEWLMYYLNGRFKTDPDHPHDNLGYITRLARSADGIHWNLPRVGAVELDGSTANNAVMGRHYLDAASQDLTGRTGPEGFCVLDAEHQHLPHVRGRYTCLFLSSPTDRYGGLGLAYSDDGIHWHGYPENPLVPGWLDTSACFFFDPRIGRYVLYTRPSILGGPHGANRKIARSESEDLVRWSLPQTVLDTDEADASADVLEQRETVIRGRDRQWYGITAFPWQEATLGLGWLYDAVSGNISLELLHSYDGIDWRREPSRTPWLADGSSDGLNGHMYNTMSTPPVQVGGEMWFYVSAANRTHHEAAESGRARTRIHVFALPCDRWVSYGTGIGHKGMLLSAPFDWRGGRIFLNAAIETGGWIRVSICDVTGREMSGCDLDCINPIEGPANGVELPLGYQAEYDKRVFSLPIHGPVRLRFTLSSARLYGWTLRV